MANKPINEKQLRELLDAISIPTMFMNQKMYDLVKKRMGEDIVSKCDIVVNELIPDNTAITMTAEQKANMKKRLLDSVLNATSQKKHTI